MWTLFAILIFLLFMGGTVALALYVHKKALRNRFRPRIVTLHSLEAHRKFLYGTITLEEYKQAPGGVSYSYSEQ